MRSCLSPYPGGGHGYSKGSRRNGWRHHVGAARRLATRIQRLRRCFGQRCGRGASSFLFHSGAAGIGLQRQHHGAAGIRDGCVGCDWAIDEGCAAPDVSCRRRSRGRNRGRRWRMKYAIVALLLVAPLAFAQELGTLTEGVMPADSSARSSVNSGRSIFVLSATQNDKAATIRLANKIPGHDDDLWHLTLSGPIDKNSDRTELAGLHGLSGKSKIEFGLQKRFGAMTATFHNTPANIARWQELCHHANQ